MKYFIAVFFLVLCAGCATASAPEQQELNEQHNTTQSEQFVSDDLVYDIDPDDFYEVDEVAHEGANQSELSEEEIDWLLLMREEEKLARDVYQVLGEQYNLQIFSSIARSEQSHMDAIGALLERYTLSDPIISDAPGAYSSELLSGLYDELLQQGSASLNDALIVGATIEDLDIQDLAEAMDATDREDIRTVYANLQKGSRNHLRAFTRQIERRGEYYTPQYISQTWYDEIVQSEQERGRVSAFAR